jgi:ADP-ribosylglycohydrolase
MFSNRELLLRLSACGKISFNLEALLALPAPAQGQFAWDRVKGMLWGVAIGDALGFPSEARLPEQRRREFGEVVGFDGRGPTPSDDTQLTLRVLAHVLQHQPMNPQLLASQLATGRIRGLGKTVKAFLKARHEGLPWEDCGQPSAGNGALMRCAPVLIPHLRCPPEDLWIEAALAAMVTHNDSAAVASAVAWTGLLWDLLMAKSPPHPHWYLERFLLFCTPLETGQLYASRSLHRPQFNGTLSQFVESELPAAWRRGWNLRQAADQWYSGAYLLETVPCALYALMLHGGDARELIVRAVNDTKDNDTIAAIVGSCAGAYHGLAGFPDNWVANVCGNTSVPEYEELHQMLERLRSSWGVDHQEFRG